jgi:hypothetical protein
MDNDSANALAGGFFIFFAILYIAIIVGVGFLYARLVGKTGYPWPWMFMLLVPGANLVFVLIFILKEWPIQEELAATRRALAEATGSPFPPGRVPGIYPGSPSLAETIKVAQGGGFGSGYDGGGFGSYGYAGPGQTAQPYGGSSYDAQPYAAPGFGTPSPAEPLPGGFGSVSKPGDDQQNPEQSKASDNPYGPKS